MRLFVYFLFISVLLFGYVALKTSEYGGHITKKCIYYNKTACETKEDDKCNKEIDCDQENKQSCYVLWSNSTNNTLYVTLRGCFISTPDCVNRNTCIARSEVERGLLFCCCEGDNCNRNFYFIPTPPPPPTVPVKEEHYEQFSYSILLVVFPFSMIVLLFFMFLHRRRKLPYINQFFTFQRNQQCPPSPALEKLMPIHLIEIKARGKYGSIWKAIYNSETVAVKIMQAQAKQSWITEQEVYKLPLMEHENILHFIGAEKHGDNLHTEFWLITAYHELGSLHDFLKMNTINWEQLYLITYSLARGLNFLHEEVPSEKEEFYKPAIAHRDLKSSNILLKSDLSACIADFGLALVFKPSTFCGETHGQVGTWRYMAPEVLEGAINFSRDSFLRIDMYACGLVLWELASRCVTEKIVPPDFKLPFEEEVGLHPSLEEIQDLVVHKKHRPVIKESWRKHLGLAMLSETMEECWDQDAEARISSCCIMERVKWYNQPCDSDTTALFADYKIPTPVVGNNGVNIARM